MICADRSQDSLKSSADRATVQSRCSMKSSRTPICKFYASGVCTAGNRCRFRHVKGAEALLRRNRCGFWKCFPGQLTFPASLTAFDLHLLRSSRGFGGGRCL
eukprot:scaffold34_cov260-Pinguiococcus_pyrenoidosus.AAC.46